MAQYVVLNITFAFLVSLFSNLVVVSDLFCHIYLFIYLLLSFSSYLPTCSVLVYFFISVYSFIFPLYFPNNSQILNY